MPAGGRVSVWKFKKFKNNQNNLKIIENLIFNLAVVKQHSIGTITGMECRGGETERDKGGRPSVPLLLFLFLSVSVKSGTEKEKTTTGGGRWIPVDIVLAFDSPGACCR